MQYKIGQILISQGEAKVEKALSQESVIIPKGNKIIIGADSFAHHIKTGMLQPLGENAQIDGYSSEGLAEWIFMYVNRKLPLDDMLEDYDETKENLIQCINEALEEIGFY